MCWPPCSSPPAISLDILRPFASDAIGARSSLPRHALAAFTSYSIGHNVGASVFTRRRGALSHLFGVGTERDRRRQYLFPAGLTFWLGNAAVLGLDLLSFRSGRRRIDQLPPWLNARPLSGIHRGCGGIGLGLIASGRVGRAWTVVPPGGPLTAAAARESDMSISVLRPGRCTLVPDEPISARRGAVYVSRSIGSKPLPIRARNHAMLSDCGRWNREDLLAGMLLFQRPIILPPSPARRFIRCPINLSKRLQINGYDERGQI